MVSAAIERGLDMRRLFVLPALFLFLLFVFPAFGADFQKGLDAAKNGDFATALTERTALAKKGDAKSQYNVGLMYEDGRGVRPDRKAAMKWYMLAAEQGLAEAHNNLGMMYEEGRTVPRDYEAALKWYTYAAHEGIAEAQDNLGFLYASGRGTSQNFQKAVEWYKLSALQGYGEAQYKLGASYKSGQGVSKDNARAHMWFQIGEFNGNNEAKKHRIIIEREMTPGEINTARKLAKEWIRKHRH
jgi:TPR repeat protein